MILVAGASFFGGLYFVAMGNQIPPFVVGLAQSSGAASYDTLEGTVVSIDAGSLTIKLLDGSTRDFALSAQTQISEAPAPVQKGAADLAPGTDVLVITSSGTTADMVQITR